MKATILTIVVLGAILATSAWFAFTGWNDVGAASHADISTHGYIAMGLGIGLSIVVGVGLMALLFFSARNGHDDVDHEL